MGWSLIALTVMSCLPAFWCVHATHDTFLAVLEGKRTNTSAMQAVCDSAWPHVRCDFVWSGGCRGNATEGVSVSELLRNASLHVGLNMTFVHNMDFSVLHSGGLSDNGSHFRLYPFHPSGNLLAQGSINPYVTQRAAPRPLSLMSQWVSPDLSPSDFRFVTTGKGVTVYVVDQDILGTHDEFGSPSGAYRVAPQESRFYSPAAAKNKGLACASWHGTHVAGLVAGLTYGAAKDAYIVPVVVLPGCDQNGATSDLIAGLDWVADRHARHQGPAVMTISILVSDSSVYNVVKDRFDDLMNMGMTIVVSAGNYAEDACLYVPSSLKAVITVAASSSSPNGNIPWASTNYGPCVNIWATGKSVESASGENTSATHVLSGTSQAAPLVAGIVAQLLQRKPNMTTQEVIVHLMQNATRSAMRELPPWTSPYFAQVDLSDYVPQRSPLLFGYGGKDYNNPNFGGYGS